jgi:hypothetical protein
MWQGAHRRLSNALQTRLWGDIRARATKRLRRASTASDGALRNASHTHQNRRQKIFARLLTVLCVTRAGAGWGGVAAATVLLPDGRRDCAAATVAKLTGAPTQCFCVVERGGDSNARQKRGEPLTEASDSPRSTTC